MIDIYAKADCLSLARERVYDNLDIPVRTALKHRMNFEGVQTCILQDTLGDVRIFMTVTLTCTADRCFRSYFDLRFGQSLVKRPLHHSLHFPFPPS